MPIPAQPFWINDFMWACPRHIPTSMKFPWVIEMCGSCRLHRPPMDLRPSPPVEETKVRSGSLAPEPKSRRLGNVGDATRLLGSKERIKISRPDCMWPPCRHKARETSPYCSKVCSDRCGRLRRKATTKILSAEDQAVTSKMMVRHTLWETWCQTR